ncbi:SURF1 family protein [Paeniroseomonas aquatica]|uniref:SURF1 family protein n=1 Tax=Paeniroseomonas aquatica TaxID=373043 RepID=UPI003612E49C
MRRRIWLPVLASLPVLAALLWLGTWQVQRLHWKTDMLDRIAAAEAGPPLPLAGSAAPYTKVVATGRLDHAREALLGVEVRGTALGGHLVTPLLRDGAPPLLVDRGWVPLTRDRGLDRPEGEVAITGYIRAADTRDWNSPKDDTAGRRFYVFDPAAIGAALGLPPPAPSGWWRWRRPGRRPGCCRRRRRACRGRTTRTSAMPSPGTGWRRRWSGC